MKRILIISLLFIACNPVKKVLNDPKKFAQVKEAVIRGGYCVNDTVTVETKRDSIVYKDSIIENTIKVPCKDFDTTLADGTSIKISSGVLKYSHNCPQKETTKTITKTNNIRDKAYENILKSDIAKRDSAIAAYVKLYNENQVKLKESAKANTKLKWKLFIVIAVFLVWTFRWSIIKLINPL
jgi:hypothetical protein